MLPDYAHHFSDRNIPFGIASSATHLQPQAVTRLGNSVIFLQDLCKVGLFSYIGNLPHNVFYNSTLNEYAALSKDIHVSVRDVLKTRFQSSGVQDLPNASKEDIQNVTMHLPVEIRDFIGMSFSRW